MHYNIKNLIKQYRSKDRGACDLYASDIQQLMDLVTDRSNACNIMWESISYAWDAGYMAGYNKAKKEARKENKNDF